MVRNFLEALFEACHEEGLGFILDRGPLQGGLPRQPCRLGLGLTVQLQCNYSAITVRLQCDYGNGLLTDHRNGCPSVKANREA